LNEALDNLYAAADSLDESKATLAVVSWSEVPVILLPSQDFLTASSTVLEKQVNQLIDTIEQNLAKTTPGG